MVGSGLDHRAARTMPRVGTRVAGRPAKEAIEKGINPNAKPLAPDTERPKRRRRE